MAYTLKSSITGSLVAFVIVDDDNATIVDLKGNAFTVDAGVTIGSATWKGQTRYYFETTTDGTFNFKGIRFSATQPSVNQTDSDGMAAGIVSAGASNKSFHPASFIEISNSAGGGSGLERVSAADAHARLTGGGGTIATTTTNIPTDGTTQFSLAGNYRSNGSTGSSKIRFGLESGSQATEATAGDDGGFGGTRSVFAIGGSAGQGNQPFKCYVAWVANRDFSDAEHDAIHADWQAFFLDLGPQPTVTATSSATPTVGSSLTITGTTFGASQGAGNVKIGGVTQTVTAWADTSITITVVRGTNKFGAGVNLVVTDNALVASAPFALTSLQPIAGWSFVDLVGPPDTVAARRLQTNPDLAAGDQIAYETLSGAVTVNSNATFIAANSVTAFQFEAWTPADGWGNTATQQLTPTWYAPAAADTYELAAKLAEFQALLNPQTWFGPIAVEKWFADELAFTASAPAGITGTLSVALGAVTASADATIPKTASLNTALGVVTLSAAAAIPHTADLSAALGAVTLSGTGSLGSGINGTLTITLGTLTTSGAGVIAISGSAAPTLGTVTLSATATNGNGISGTLNSALGAVTVTAAGAAAIAGTFNTALGAVTLNGAATIPRIGTLSITLGGVTLTATGGGIPAITGTLNAALGQITIGASANAAISGSLNAALGAVSLSSGEPAVYSGGNAAIGLGLLAASTRIGNTRLTSKKGRIGL